MQFQTFSVRSLRPKSIRVNQQPILIPRSKTKRKGEKGGVDSTYVHSAAVDSDGRSTAIRKNTKHGTKVQTR
jgi:hypothetical protein